MVRRSQCETSLCKPLFTMDSIDTSVNSLVMSGITGQHINLCSSPEVWILELKFRSCGNINTSANDQNATWTKIQDSSPEEEPLLYCSACKLFQQLLPISFFLPCPVLENVLKFYRISRTLHLLFCLFSFLSDSSFLLVHLFSVEPKICLL